MQSKSLLHFGLMCNRSNGGFDSAVTLIEALQEHYRVQAWSLFGETYAGHKRIIERLGTPLHYAKPAIEIGDGEHVILYMNDYPQHFRNYSEQWRLALARAGSVQIAFNRTLGAMPLESWLGEKVNKIIFQDLRMQGEWAALVESNCLADVPTAVLPPPVNLAPYLAIERRDNETVVVGRLAGDGAVQSNSISLYHRLAENHPDAEFWFMPSPSAIFNEFSHHPQFRFFDVNEISVTEFLEQSDVYLLTYQDGVPIPGPRSLVEAMAAGCAPVVVNRDGPRLRVEHGVSGFHANSNDEFLKYTGELIQNQALRSKVSEAARERAASFKLCHWTDEFRNSIDLAEQGNLSNL